MKKKVFNIVIASLLALTATAQQIPSWKLPALKAAIAGATKPTIFNFWATFCGPCVQEIPYFQSAVQRRHDSLSLVLVSLDLPETYPARIRSFAQAHRFTAPIRYLAESDADLFCPAVDSSWSGAIPASLFINPVTGYRRFYESKLSPAQLEAAINELLKPR